MSLPTESVVTLDLKQWHQFLSSLYERDDRLERREAGETYSVDEEVDAYVFSGHAEALLSAEVDGDLWGTLADIEEEAQTEEGAWAKICTFYLARGCVLVRVKETEEPEEWIVASSLAQRLGLSN